MKDKIADFAADMWHRFNSLDDIYKSFIFGFIAGIGATIIVMVL